jgi:ubiquitin C-terminal hydrolase
MESELELQINQSYRFHSFRNRGNACFINVAMELLIAIVPLRNLSENLDIQTPFMQAYRQALNSNHLLVPNTPFWTIAQEYLGYTPAAIRQNCAVEFLRFFLGGLDSELQGIVNRQSHDDAWQEVGKRNKTGEIRNRVRGLSMLYDILGVTFRREYNMSGEISVNYHEEPIIVLQIMDKLTHSFAEELKPKEVEDFRKNGVPVKCTTRSLIDNFSPYLFIHVQRLRVKNGRVEKSLKFIEYPPRFRIPDEHLSNQLRIKVQNEQIHPPEYELVGFVVHHGLSVEAGHYICVLRSGKYWIMIDDENIRNISPEQVRKMSVYLLLYKIVSMQSIKFKLL